MKEPQCRSADRLLARVSRLPATPTIVYSLLFPNYTYTARTPTILHLHKIHQHLAIKSTKASVFCFIISSPMSLSFVHLRAEAKYPSPYIACHLNPHRYILYTKTYTTPLCYLIEISHHKIYHHIFFFLLLFLLS